MSEKGEPSPLPSSSLQLFLLEKQFNSVCIKHEVTYKSFCDFSHTRVSVFLSCQCGELADYF